MEATEDILARPPVGLQWIFDEVVFLGYREAWWADDPETGDLQMQDPPLKSYYAVLRSGYEFIVDEEEARLIAEHINARN